MRPAKSPSGTISATGWQSQIVSQFRTYHASSAFDVKPHSRPGFCPSYKSLRLHCRPESATIVRAAPDRNHGRPYKVQIKPGPVGLPQLYVRQTALGTSYAISANVSALNPCMAELFLQLPGGYLVASIVEAAGDRPQGFPMDPTPDHVQVDSAVLDVLDDDAGLPA